MNRLAKSTLPSIRPIGGMMTSSTSEVMILPKAAPMITPTARSRTLPRTASSLNSLSIAPLLLRRFPPLLYAARHHEQPPRPLGAEGLGIVIAVEDGGLPGEEIRIARRERLEGLPLGCVRHPLVDQEEVGPGDGLVVEAGMAVEDREALDPFGEAGEGRQDGVAPQVDPGQADVVPMVEFGVGQGTALEAADEFFVGHGNFHFVSPKAKAPGGVTPWGFVKREYSRGPPGDQSRGGSRVKTLIPL